MIRLDHPLRRCMTDWLHGLVLVFGFTPAPDWTLANDGLAQLHLREGW